MNIQQVLRDLLDVIDSNQSQEQDIEVAPVIDTTEVTIDDAQQEFDSEQADDSACSCDAEPSDFPELDVVKRNAGLPVLIISSEE